VKKTRNIGAWLRVLIHVAVVRPFLRLFFGVNAIGAEHLEGLDQYILIANHNSHLDVMLLFSVLPARHILKTRPVAAYEYFSKSKPLFRVVDYLFRPIWVVRGEKTDDPFKGMKEHLDSGGGVIIFPEGTRGKPGEMEKFKSGIGMLALTCPNIPIVPAFLLGPERAFPKTSPVPIPLWNEVTIGPPQILTGTRRNITAALQNLVQELSRSAVANRHRRRKKRRPSVTVAVLCTDGAERNALSRALAVKLSESSEVCLVTDGLEFYQAGTRKEVQPLTTERMRETMGRYAKAVRTLERYRVPKLAELLLREHIMTEVERWYSPRFIILDGCPLLNMAGWANLYRADQFDAQTCATAFRALSGCGEPVPYNDPVFAKFPELAALRRLRLASMRLPNAVIMIDVAPHASTVTVGPEDGDRHAQMTVEDVAKLREGYCLVCDVVKADFDIPTHVIDGSSDRDTQAEAALAFIESFS